MWRRSRILKSRYHDNRNHLTLCRCAPHVSRVPLSFMPPFLLSKGVELYVSNFQRPLSERITKGFFSDPASAAVACVRTGPVTIADNVATGKAGEEVFEESKSLLFKTLKVRRVYDEEKKTLVYVSFNTRLDKNADSNNSRFKSSLCAISLD